jgi:HlyD family secretion protein
MRKKILMAGFALLVVAALVVAGLARADQARREAEAGLQTATVHRGPLVATVDTAGTVQAAGAVSLAFQASSGQVIEVRAREGDAVEAGQVIARLDATDAGLQVAQAEVGLAIAQARLDQLRQKPSAEDIAAAQAALASAEEGLRRLRAGPTAESIELARLRWEQAKSQLWGAQCQRDATCANPLAAGPACDQARASVAVQEMAVEMARIQYEQAQQGAGEGELRAAEAQVAQARASLARLTRGAAEEDIRVAEAQVRQAEITLQQATSRLDQMALVAPFAGIVTRLDLQVGKIVAPGTPVGTLSSAGGLQVAADMSEIDVARIRVGQEALITLDALPERALRGHVIGLAPAGVSLQGVVSFPITIALDDTDPAVRSGMTASISIVVEHREDALLVPSRAIRTQDGRRVVYVQREGQASEVPVHIGLSGNGHTEILDGALEEGDVVILSTPGLLQRLSEQPDQPDQPLFMR